MESRISGTTGSHQRVRPDECSKIMCILPDEEIMNMFNDLVEPIFENIERSKKFTRVLNQIISQLLPIINDDNLGRISSGG